MASFVRMRAIFLALLATLASAELNRFTTSASDLRVEYQKEPLGLSESQPRFSFTPQCVSTNDGKTIDCPRGTVQSVYRVQVTSATTGATMWDSGNITSNRSSQIEYAGQNLTAYLPYSWSVQWWGAGSESASVVSSTFEMGPITPADWRGASWLEGPRLRVNFTLPASSPSSKLLRARAYISAPGGHTLQVNGKANGDQMGVSAWLRFDKSVLYQTHDITDYVSPGQNTLELLIGKGFFGHTAVMARVVAFYSDGQKLDLGTAPGSPRHAAPSQTSAWSQAVGLVQSDSPFIGTVIDWRLLDSKRVSWEPAEVAATAPAGTMRALSIPAARVLRTVAPMNVTKLPNGHLVFKFPENFVGVVQLKLAKMPADGSNISVKHGEVLHADGSVSFPWHEEQQTDVHILGPDVAAGTLLTPRFTWHGFQFVEVAADVDSGFDGQLNSIIGLVVGADIDRTGSVLFSGGTEAKMLNAIQGLVVASQLSNLAGYIPTDCPTREKHGWLGDAQVTAEEALFNFDMAQVYTNYMQMIQDDQMPANTKHAGDLLGVVPSKAHHLTSDARSTSGITDISWSAAYPLIARWVLKYYGDLRVVSRHWESLKTFVDQLSDYASSHCSGGLADFFTWGDWCAVESRALATPGTGPELAAFNYILSLDAMAEMAHSLASVGDHPSAAADAARYAALAKKFRPIFHKRFFNESSNAYGSRELELQSLTVAPLALGDVVPKTVLPAVISSLSNDVKSNDNHFTVGSVGAKHLLPQLTAHGLHEQAMAIATQTTFPSFGFWLENGATTCWENYRGVADPSHPPPPTHNHIFLCGGVGEWMYRSVAGIAPALDGYDKFTIAPQMGQGPSAASAQLKTVRGLASVSWAAAPHQASWSLDVAVPVSSRALVVLTSLPSGATSDSVTVKESGIIVWKDGAFQSRAPGVLSGRAASKNAIEFEVTSGAFGFSIESGSLLFV